MLRDSVDPVDSAVLFANAIRVAGSDDGRDSNDYWRLIRLLHAQPETVVFERAVACCSGATSAERIVGADVLAQLGALDANAVRPFTERTIPVLRRLLVDQNDDVVASAIHALAHHRRAATSDFREFAAHESPRNRYAVTHALSGRDDPEAIALLLRLMTDVDDTVRDWATFAIGTLCAVDDPNIREALTHRLSDPDEDVRGEALVGLARRRDPSVVDRIAEALEGADPSRFVFDAAEEILAAHPQEERVRMALAKWQAK